MGNKAIKLKNKNGDTIFPCPYYPVGSIYLSVNNINPSTFFGGTWERIKDKFLLACGDTYSAGSAGGEANHKLTIEETPIHNHIIPGSKGNAQWAVGDLWFRAAGANNDGNTYADKVCNNTGGGKTHNNMPPYLSIYVWRRKT